MTDADLLELYHRRNARLKSLGGNGSGIPLGAMGSADRAEADRMSREFRAADAAIVAELVARGRPARLGEVTLWLTSDSLNYVELDPKTGDPLYADKERGTISRSVLMKYIGRKFPVETEPIRLKTRGSR